MSNEKEKIASHMAVEISRRHVKSIAKEIYEIEALDIHEKIQCLLACASDLSAEIVFWASKTGEGDTQDVSQLAINVHRYLDLFNRLLKSKANIDD